jgi:hypothetical protein
MNLLSLHTGQYFIDKIAFNILTMYSRHRTAFLQSEHSLLNLVEYIININTYVTLVQIYDSILHWNVEYLDIELHSAM